MGALALATETPSPKLLDAKPAGRQEPLINGKMFKHIIAQGFYQLFWMFLFLYGLPKYLPAYSYTPTCQLYSSQGGNFCVQTVGVEQLKLTAADAAAACNAINQCGLPCGSTGAGSTCQIQGVAWTNAGASDAQAVLCKGSNGTSCPAYDQYK